MDETAIWIFIVVVIGFIIYHTTFSRSAVVDGIISKTPGKKISDVQEGDLVRISGKVVFLGRTMLAPLSKRKCVYYHVLVKDSSGRKDMFKNYINLDEERVTDVIIYDGENYALINTNLVASNVIKDQSFYSGFWSNTSPELKAFLKKHKERETDYVGWSLDLNAQEGVLEEGEILTVAGKASWRNTSDFGFKIPAKKLLYVNPLNEHGVYMTDDPTVNY